jgi:hypothetical protein
MATKPTIPRARASGAAETDAKPVGARPSSPAVRRSGFSRYSRDGSAALWALFVLPTVRSQITEGARRRRVQSNPPHRHLDCGYRTADRAAHGQLIVVTSIAPMTDRFASGGRHPAAGTPTRPRHHRPRLTGCPAWYWPSPPASVAAQSQVRDARAWRLRQIFENRVRDVRSRPQIGIGRRLRS